MNIPKLFNQDKKTIRNIKTEYSEDGRLKEIGLELDDNHIVWIMMIEPDKDKPFLYFNVERPEHHKLDPLRARPLYNISERVV